MIFVAKKMSDTITILCADFSQEGLDGIRQVSLLENALNVYFYWMYKQTKRRYH